MQIDRVLFPITTLGPGKRIGIWTVGCPRRCFKCSNPELWESDETRDIQIPDLMARMTPQLKNADGVTVTGGDPFFQPEELYVLLKSLKNAGVNDILVYTGYTYEIIKSRYPHTLDLIDVLIDEPYDDDLNNNMGIMGSTNQHIVINNRLLTEKYRDMSEVKRQRQNFIFDGKIISAGIPARVI